MGQGNIVTNFVDNYLVWLAALAMGVLLVRNFSALTTGVGTLTSGASSFIQTVSGR